ncbi:uncharacterized protein LOC135479190 [Liolophura sinensis]|uniref:uncharacterized protein LOC135479190 n=1 Tax=Liolophura sinensis TaxID=3198878 RepID=UPI0031592BD4
MKSKHAKGIRCNGYRLSPNEEARILQEETEKRRKLRLLQVRELSKRNAASIRQSVKAEKEQQIQKLAKKLEKNLASVKEEKLRNLEARYDNSMRTIGIAHKEAEQQEDKTEELLALAEENTRKAELRYKTALDALHVEQEQQQMEEKYHILARKAALEMERIRANQIASLPPPPPDPTLDIGKAKHKPVKMTDATAFSLTHFHMAQDIAVEKENPELQADARVLAVDEEERIKEEQRKIEQGEQERRERARVRHNLAREKELLKQDYEHMLHDLSDLQRADMYRRQKVVANIPKQVFEPPHRRLEHRRDRQRTMEQAFEDMYMKATDYTGDLSLALDPYPQMDTPSATEASEVSATSDADQAHDLSTTQTDRPQPLPPPPRSETLKDVTNVAKDSSGQSPKKSETVLKKLLNQIKNQRDDWITRSSQEAPEPEDVLSMSPQLFKKYQREKECPVATLPKTNQDNHVPDTLASPPHALTDMPSEKAFPLGREQGRHQKLSPPVKDQPSQHVTSDREPVGKVPAGVAEDSHERCVEEARRELQQIQEKKAALEEKLRQYAVQQQQQQHKQQMEESVVTRSKNVLGNLDNQLQDQHLYVARNLKDIDNADQVIFATSALPPGAESTQEGQKTLDDDVYPESLAIVRGQTGIKTADQQDSEQLRGEPAGLDLNVLSEVLAGNTESDHVRRIREYQQRLLERHKSWKMLAETRSDIERRRIELRQRYPQLNIPQMEPLPTSGSLSLLNAPRPFPPTSSVLPSQDPLVTAEPSLAQPVSAIHNINPNPKEQPNTFSLQQSNGVSATIFPPALPSGVVAMPTTSSTILQTNGLSDKGALASKVEQPKMDNVRKQLLFDSETPKTSPEKQKPKSPLTGRRDMNRVVHSEKNELPPNAAVSDFATAVPLGQSRVRKKIQVSPANISPTEDQSLDHSGIDPILALTEAAKERKLYFEKRQRQLTQQLEEIQNQKAAYLSQHEDSQRRLQEHRQRVLRELIQGFPSETLDDAITREQPLEVLRSSNSVAKPETGTRHPDSLQNVSFKSLSSVGRKTWADLLHDATESADSASIDPVSLLNGSQASAPDSHQPHELSTILEVDTPPQSKSLSTSRRRSEGQDDADGLVIGPPSHGNSISGAEITDDRFSSQRISMLPPPGYEDVTRIRDGLDEDDFEEGYEPFATGLVLRKSDDITLKTVSEASAAVARAHQLLAQTAIPLLTGSDTDAHLYDNQSSGSDLVSAISGSQSHASAEFCGAELLFSKRDQKESSNNSSVWRSPDIYEGSSPHSSEVTQYSAPSESARSNGSEAIKSTESLTQYMAYSNGEKWGNGTMWMTKDRQLSPSGVSEVTQYSGASGVSQDSTGKRLHSSEVLGDSGKVREMGSAEMKGRIVDKVATFNSPSELELTQFSHNSEKTSSQDKSSTLFITSKSQVDEETIPGYHGNDPLTSHTEIAELRPKSSTSVSATEITQYSCSPILELNTELEVKGGKSTETKELTHATSPSMPGIEEGTNIPVTTESQILENASSQMELTKNVLNKQSLHSAKSLTERRAVTSSENVWSSDLTECSATSVGESCQRNNKTYPQKNSSLREVSDIGDMTSYSSSPADHSTPAQSELGRDVKQMSNSESQKESLPFLDLSQKSKENQRDIFRAVKVFIEPPNSQSSPQGTERSGRDRTQGSSVSQGVGIDVQSGPSESSSYMTLPAMSRANPLAMTDFSAFSSHVNGDFHSKTDSFETFGSSGYQPLSEDSWKTPGMTSHHEDSLALDLHKWKEYLQLGSPDKSQISLSEPGIMEEAELTLVSSASITSPSRLHDSQSESLVSFERHEASVDDIGVLTPRQKSDQRHDDIMLYLEPGDKMSSEKRGMTLQDAFLAKKKGFATASEKRVLEAKEKALGLSAKEKPHVEPAQSGLTKMLASWKKSRGIRAPSKPSPGRSQLTQKTKTTPDRKKQEKEKVERTKRLYNQLEEVKERNLIKEREKQYAANRDKAKQYHKKMQENLKKKRASKK